MDKSILNGKKYIIIPEWVYDMGFTDEKIIELIYVASGIKMQLININVYNRNRTYEEV